MDRSTATDPTPHPKKQEGGCIYLPGWLCEPGDFALLLALTRELQAYSERTGTGMINWSQ